MDIKKSRVLQRDISPRTIIVVCTLAAAIVVTLWMAGVDGGAMKILLASLLFGLASYVSFLNDPRHGEVSLSQGGIAGGILMLVYFVVVVCKHSFETTGMLYPKSTLEVALLVLSSLFFVLFGAGVGGMTAVIGDTLLRVTYAIVRRWSFSRYGKSKRELEL